MSTKRFGTWRIRPSRVGGSVNSGISGGGDSGGGDGVGGDGVGKGMCEGPATGTRVAAPTLRLRGPDCRIRATIVN